MQITRTFLTEKSKKIAKKLGKKCPAIIWKKINGQLKAFGFCVTDYQGQRTVYKRHLLFTVGPQKNYRPKPSKKLPQ